MTPGLSEKQIKLCDQEEDLSEEMTKKGISHFYISLHPLEGMNVTGADTETTKHLIEVLKEDGFEDRVGQSRMETGGNLDRFGTRRNKRNLLRRIFQTCLRPLPMAFKEITSFDLKRYVFSNMIGCLTENTGFKWGMPLPQSMEKWYDEDDKDLWPLLRGQNYHTSLGRILKEKGYRNAGDFYSKLIKRCYEDQAGPSALEKFRMNQSLEQVLQLLTDFERVEDDVQDIEEERIMERAQSERKQKEQEEEDDRRRKEEEEQEEQEDGLREAAETDVAQERERSMRPRIRDRDASRERDRSRSQDQEIQSRNSSTQNSSQLLYTSEEWSQMLSPGVLKELHRDDKTNRPRSLVQILKKNITGGQLTSLLVNDGLFHSENIIPGNELVIQQLLCNMAPVYCVLELLEVSIHKDKLKIHKMKFPQDNIVNPQQPIAAPGSSAFEKLSQQTLDFWGIQFAEEVPVKLNTKNYEDDLNMSIFDPNSTRYERAAVPPSIPKKPVTVNILNMKGKGKQPIISRQSQEISDSGRPTRSQFRFLLT